jgi:hypothetical protein
VLQKTKEHGKEEHYVDYEDTCSIDVAPARMKDYAGIHDGIVRPSDLVYVV